MSIAKSKPAVSGSAVTPSDSTELNPPTRALWIGGAGNLAVLLADDTVAITLVGVAAGTLLPISVTKVLSTGTTATDIAELR